MVNTLIKLKLLGRTVAALTALGLMSPLVAPGLIQADSQTPQQVARSITAPRADRPRVLLVGGGPSAEHNQVAIESNVRYILRLLPQGADRTVLFADGDGQKATVLFEAKAKELKPAEELMALLLSERDDAHPADLKYRKPTLPQIDGPSRKDAVTAAFDKLATAQTPRAPVLLYFTGHGSPSRASDRENNAYDLWEGGGLSVKDLAADVSRLPADEPVTLVMVQCFSGAFANLLYQDGDPNKPMTDRDIAGFFAAIKERMAAGCTPAVNEAEYHDFTSYFFAALSGQDRVGRRVTGADYNHDGRVTMDEAYCYTLANDASIDVPVCTSDIFLRKVMTTSDQKVFQTTFRDALSWATPAQHAALEQLSANLKLRGDDRAQKLYDQMFSPNGQPERRNPMAAALRSFAAAREDGRRLLFSRWPDLREEQSAGHAAAKQEALEMLPKWIDEGKFKAVFDADDALDKAEDAAYRQEIEEARMLRFVRLFKSVVLAHELRENGDPAIQKRFEKLVSAEGRRPAFLDSGQAVASAR